MTVLIPPACYAVTDKQSRAWPLTMALGIDRLGYLQHDLYPGRLFLPTMPGYDQLEVVPRYGYLEAKSDDEVVADLYYWNAGWGPVRPIQLDGNCGTALVSRGTAYRKLPGLADQMLRSFYLWRVRTLQRKYTYDSFDETLSFGVVFV